MSNLNVTYGDMKDAAARLRQGKEEMDQKLVELGNLIHGLTGSGFQTDQASHAYTTAFENFQAGTTKAVDALEGLAQFLDQASEALSQTDTQLSNSIQS